MFPHDDPICQGLRPGRKVFSQSQDRKQNQDKAEWRNSPNLPSTDPWRWHPLPPSSPVPRALNTSYHLPLTKSHLRSKWPNSKYMRLERAVWVFVSKGRDNLEGWELLLPENSNNLESRGRCWGKVLLHLFLIESSVIFPYVVISWS